MKIALLGCFFSSDNLGCSALACSVLKLLHEIGREEKLKLELVVFEPGANPEHAAALAKELSVEDAAVTFSRVAWVYSPRCLVRPGKYLEMTRNLKQCDLAIDITGGDSFADIYGKKRFYFWSNIKKYILNHKIPLILAPQTYGPFYNADCRELAKEIVDRACLVMTRDRMSKDCLREITQRNVELTTDVAFELPGVALETIDRSDGKINVGINVSGLLYADTSDSKLSGVELKISYRDYIHQLIEWLLAQGKYRVYLISHVVSDQPSVQAVGERYPECIAAPFHKDPIAMKGFIAQLDVFIGSRMHATVAAFSSGIPTIPVAYSRKFAGLYENLGYRVNIDLEHSTLELALQQTVAWVENRAELSASIQESLKTAQNMRAHTRALFRKALTEVSGF